MHVCGRLTVVEKMIVDGSLQSFVKRFCKNTGTKNDWTWKIVLYGWMLETICEMWLNSKCSELHQCNHKDSHAGCWSLLFINTIIIITSWKSKEILQIIQRFSSNAAVSICAEVLNLISYSIKWCALEGMLHESKLTCSKN